MADDEKYDGQRFLIGTARREITPPLGVELSGYGVYRQRRAAAVRDPLYTRALAVASDVDTWLLIVNDLIGIGALSTARIRAYLQEELKVKPHRIMVHNTHTHSGPAGMRLRGWGELDDGYIAHLEQQIVANAVAADHDKVPGKLLAGSTTSPGLSVNRVKEGGPIDPQLTVLLLQSPDGQPLCILAHFTCHPVHIAPGGDGGDLISAEFPGALCHRLEQRFGVPVFFLQGACGDINPAGLHQGFEAMTATGAALAEAAAAVIERNELMPAWGPSGALSQPLALPFVRVAPAELRETARKARQTLLSTPPYDAEGEVRRAQLMLQWVQDLEAARARQDAECWLTELQVLRLGEVALVGAPGELFHAFAHEIASLSPFAHTLTLNYTNDFVGYLPDRHDYLGEGWGARGYAANMVPKIMGKPPFVAYVGSLFVHAASGALWEMAKVGRSTGGLKAYGHRTTQR